MKSCSSEVRRCRPLLGTFVEITVNCKSAEESNGAIVQAFAAVERVQRLMSFYERYSDVTQLNRYAARRAIKVSPWTYQVLLAAQRLREATKGIFDITVAGHLQRWGYLPTTNGVSADPAAATTQAAIELLPDNRVRFRQPAQIDLGGIAKGFAVDKAVETLQAVGTLSGIVNAGGDLRVFGPAVSVIHVRHPRAPGQMLPLTRLTNAAIATSANYFMRKNFHGRPVSPLIDPIRNQPCRRTASVSVQAPTCIVADALTKVVMILGERSTDTLRDYSASALIVTRTGKVISPEPRDDS